MHPHPLDNLFLTAVEKKQIPGVVAMAANATEIIYQGAFGYGMDEVFWLASLTKVVTAVAIMQLVEQGKLQLQQSAAEILPELADLQVLEGFNAIAEPILRPAKTIPTIQHLLTHSAGFTYHLWDENIKRYKELLNLSTHERHAVLTFDPGTQSEYGINYEWLGLIIEKVSQQTLAEYFATYIFQPLKMSNTGFSFATHTATLHQKRRQRFIPMQLQAPTGCSGGSGLYSSAKDFLSFCQMLLQHGTFQQQQILTPTSVAFMFQQIKTNFSLRACKSTLPQTTHDLLFSADQQWGFGALTSTQQSSVWWGGLANTFFSLNFRRQFTTVVFSQYFPFLDSGIVDLYKQFENCFND